MLAAATGSDVVLPLLIAVPLIGALVVAFARETTTARTIATGVGLAVLLLSVLALRQIGTTQEAGGMFRSLGFEAPGFLTLGVGEAASQSFQFSLKADAISAWLVALAAVLTPCAMLATKPNLDRAGAYFAWLLVLEAAVIGVFLASDLLLFYVFFELSLVPSFFLIGQWGGLERRQAAVKFFVYTFAGSVFMLASIVYVVLHARTFDIANAATYVQTQMGVKERFWVLLGFLAGLCVKVPLLPLHTWLPTTYTNAPAPVSALLSGILAKLGTYGLLRLALPMGLLGVAPKDHPDHFIVQAMIVLSLIAIVYAALVAWVQKDFKTLQAYSSISHLGFCVLALLAMNTLGGQASVLYMINHGISTAGMFFLLGMIETRVNSRNLNDISGLGRDRPWLAGLFVLFVMSSIGLPLTNGFVSEFLAILSPLSAGYSLWVTVIAASGVVLGAIYMLHLTAKLIFGPVVLPAEAGTPNGVVFDKGVIPDLNRRELAALLPLAALVLALGVMPNVVLDSIKGPVAAAMSHSTPPFDPAELATTGDAATDASRLATGN